ncbi:hypothetical protein UlMin_010029 [Ulmus minor]
MSMSHETNARSGRLNKHEYYEDSAARTRPLSYEEIMLRRKNKSLSEDVKEGFIAAGIKSSEGIDKNASRSFESDRGIRHHRDSSPIAEKLVAEVTTKISSSRKEKNTSMNTKSEEHHLKRKDRETRESEGKLKARRSSETGHEVKGGKDDKQIHSRRDYVKRSADTSKNESGKKHSRDSTGKASHADLGRGKYVRESKRSYRNGDDEKIKDRNTAKKLDSGRHYDRDISERKERKESSKSRLEEPRVRRNRSRSRDHQDKSRRSRSVSPRAHKSSPYHRVEYREVASHSLKEQHSDVDKKKLSGNGSSSHSRRHDGHASRLGGYSPRKRITEAAAKTPSPPNHSLEKKSAKWDLQPSGINNKIAGSVPSNFQLSNSIVSSKMHEFASSVPVASATLGSLARDFVTALTAKKTASIDSVQLTQATRPMRRLYVENVPSSVSEKALVEWLNNRFLSSGVNHIKGTQPCISCIINKEKGQALVEFLTPEDALAALSFDGSSISGSAVKIRRPKDFIEVATGDLEKSVASDLEKPVAADLEKSAAAVDAISDVVKDSPDKIFIGGISNTISSKMLMEIVSAFGPLKAYHFEVGQDLNEACAFLEYVDQSVTPKACAGLNGMKLGGKVLTVVQAIRGEASLENTGSSPSYEIPEHAKPLLRQPTQVLKLKNVFNTEDFSSLSEPEVEDVLDDLRLECARFGKVKSINVVKQCSSHPTSTGACEINNSAQYAEFEANIGCEDKKVKTDTVEGHIDGEFSGISKEEIPSDAKEHKLEEVPKDTIEDDKPVNLAADESCQTGQLSSDIPLQVEGCVDNSNRTLEELPDQQNNPKELSEHHNDSIASTILMDVHGSEIKLVAEDQLTLEDADRAQGTSAELAISLETGSDVMEKGDDKEGTSVELVGSLETNSDVMEKKGGDKEQTSTELFDSLEKESDVMEKGGDKERTSAELVGNLETESDVMKKGGNNKQTSTELVDGLEKESDVMEKGGNKERTSAELVGNLETESDVMEKGSNNKRTSAELVDRAIKKGGVKKEDSDLGSIFEMGCVFVEFGRTEESCTAAHCLHGRFFDDRIVTVEYVSLDHYRARFPK